MFIGLNPKTNKYMWVQNGQGNFWLGRDVNDGPEALTPQELMEYAKSIQAQLQRVSPELFPLTGPTLTYVRELEAEAVAVKKERDALIATIAEIAGRVDTSRIAIHNDEECYLLDWQDYVALRTIAAANEATS